MKLPRYESYQQPDDDWLGEIPEHWNVRRTKTMFTLQKTKVGKASSDYTLLSLTLGGVIVRDMDEGGKFPAEFDDYQIVQRDDLVFCLFDIDETPRTIGIAHNHGMITGAYSVYRALPSCVPEYACYYFLHLDSFKGLRPFYTGLRKVVRADTFSKVGMPAPPIDEQKQIAAFLDYETAKIDALIEKQQQLIALLGEKRQAVISHAVTKGLNPDAPMRDSGVEWLGEVPEHWTVSRIKHVVGADKNSMVDGPFGSSVNTDVDYVETGTPVIRTVNITNSGFSDESLTFMREEKFRQLQRHAVYPGDVLFSKVGTIGNSCVLPESVPEAILSTTGSCKITVAPDLCAPEFLVLCIQSMHTKLMEIANANVQPFLNMGDIKNLQLPLPPLGEQEDVLAYLDGMLNRFDAVIEKAEASAELLQERRTALISAAVTGKIDVRGWKPPSADSQLETEMEVA